MPAIRASVRRQSAVATTAALVFVAAISAQAKPPLEEITERTYAVPADAKISVRNTDGTIYIYAWENAAMKVTSRKKAYTQERLKQIAVNVNVNGANVTIDSVFPPQPRGPTIADRSGTMDYLILLPQSCTIENVELSSGEIIMEGLRGPAVNARLTNGRLTTRNCFSNAHLSVANGALDIYYDWWEPLTFAFTARIGQGHLNLLFPSYASLHLNATSGNGKVTNKFAQTPEQREAPSLNTTIGGENGAEFNLQATNGNITIHESN